MSDGHAWFVITTRETVVAGYSAHKVEQYVIEAETADDAAIAVRNHSEFSEQIQTIRVYSDVGDFHVNAFRPLATLTGKAGDD